MKRLMLLNVLVALVVLPACRPAKYRASSDFAPERFNQIRVGDTRESVRRLLGDPLTVRDHPAEYLARIENYTMPIEATDSMEIYCVVFDKFGKVLEKYSYGND